jgi:hypothetical protein
MRVMVFAKVSEDSLKGEPPSPEAWAAMDKFTEELAEAGVLVAAAGLKSSDFAKRIDVHGASRTVTDGPFTEARELIAGFSIWQVKDMDEALAWAKRSPNAMSGPSAIELWPFMEIEDLPDFLSPEDLAAPREGDRGKLGVA